MAANFVNGTDEFQRLPEFQDFFVRLKVLLARNPNIPENMKDRETAFNDLQNLLRKTMEANPETFVQAKPVLNSIIHAKMEFSYPSERVVNISNITFVAF